MDSRPLHACHNNPVDFVRVIEQVGGFLAGHGHRYAVAGGVALATYGHPRLTLDLDVVTTSAAQPVLIPFMEGLGYATLHQSSGFSNHRHPDRAMGRVDFIYVKDLTATRLFDGVRDVPGPGGKPIPLPRPEHLIAMKVQAMKNAPERTWQEMVDIGYLLGLPGIDRVEARGYFEKADLLERWRELNTQLSTGSSISSATFR